MTALVRVTELRTANVKDPIFVEGLPGIGNVGMLAVQHLADALGAQAWCDIQGAAFPPQVMVDAEGKIRLVGCRLWTVPAKGKSPALVLMTGDHQPMTGDGQYALVDAVLDRVAATGCKTIYTLGGFGVGAAVGDPDVIGAATDDAMVQRLRKIGVKFGDEEPGGGIIGASGLFLGLAMQRGMTGACLMGETNGYMVDPRAARAVLDKLATLIQRDVPTDDLGEKAKEIDRLAGHLQREPREPSDVHYIG